MKDDKSDKTIYISRKLLSRQQHYDWGLRALKSVLRTAGDGLRVSSADTRLDEIAEMSVVVRALNFNTLSKLTGSDSTLFLGLVNDMFPDVVSNDSSPPSIFETIKECYKDMGLIFLERQVIFENSNQHCLRNYLAVHISRRKRL